MKKHSNLSIFVPHLGCPCRCSFCNQNKISGTESAPTPQNVTDLCSEFLPQGGDKNGQATEIAFFGGSFTAIEPSYMVSLLETAYSFVLAKRASGIRISTRPDAISPQILQTLKQYGVTSIELGAQSMDNTVLEKNRRGHTVQAVIDASKLIKQYGFSLGLQMMVGLYGEADAEKSAIKTMQSFISLKPDTVRIYPALVLQDTYLAQLYKNGEYTPLSVDLAAEICAKLIPQFEQNQIKVIRVGLHADTEMEKSFIAGPYHPAFKQICETKIYFKIIQSLLKNKKSGEYTLQIPKGQYSTVAGQKNQALAELKAIGYNIILQESEKLTARQVQLL